jgi:hypothetical protein
MRRTNGSGRLIIDGHHSRPRPPSAPPTSSIHMGLSRVPSVIAAAAIVTTTPGQLVSAARAMTVPLAIANLLKLWVAAGSPAQCVQSLTKIRRGRSNNDPAQGCRIRPETPVQARDGGDTAGAELRAGGAQPVRPQPRLSGCHRFGQGTFAGTHGNGRDAPIADLPARAPERGSSTQSRRSRVAIHRSSVSTPDLEPLSALKRTRLDYVGVGRSTNLG